MVLASANPKLVSIHTASYYIHMNNYNYINTFRDLISSETSFNLSIVEMTSRILVFKMFLVGGSSSPEIVFLTPITNITYCSGVNY